MLLDGIPCNSFSKLSKNLFSTSSFTWARLRLIFVSNLWRKESLYLSKKVWPHSQSGILFLNCGTFRFCKSKYLLGIYHRSFRKIGRPWLLSAIVCCTKELSSLSEITVGLPTTYFFGMFPNQLIPYSIPWTVILFSSFLLS